MHPYIQVYEYLHMNNVQLYMYIETDNLAKQYQFKRQT